MHVPLSEYLIGKISEQIKLFHQITCSWKEEELSENLWEMARSSRRPEALKLGVEPSRVRPTDTTFIFFSSFWLQGKENTENSLREQRTCWNDSGDSRIPRSERKARPQGREKLTCVFSTCLPVGAGSLCSPESLPSGFCSHLFLL